MRQQALSSLTAGINRKDVVTYDAMWDTETMFQNVSVVKKHLL
jgi:hypothetical protein